MALNKIPQIHFYYNGKLILDNDSLPLKVKSTKNLLAKLPPLKKGTSPDLREMFYDAYEDLCSYSISDLKQIGTFNFFGIASKTIPC